MSINFNTLNIVFLLLFLVSCSQGSIKIPEKKLVEETSVNEFETSFFSSDVRSILIKDQTLYFTDKETCKLFITDFNLNLLETFGQKGRGPEDFLGPYHISFPKDSLIVFNDFSREFDIINSEREFLSPISLPSKGRYAGNKFFIHDNWLYFSYYTDDSSLGAINTKTGEEKFFGKIISFSNKKQERIRNNWELVKGEKTFFAVLNNLPIIKQYDFDGNLINEYNYKNLRIIKTTLERNKNKQEKLADNAYIKLVRDVYYFEHSLFILYNTREDNGKISSNIILEFKHQKDNNMQPTGYYHLSNQNSISAFAVNRDNIFAFERRKGSLIKYQKK
ncbi:hypothetical protein [Marinilabilia sp.]